MFLFLVCIFKFISCDDHISFDCPLLWLLLLRQENQLYFVHSSVLIIIRRKSSHILNLVDFLSFCWFVYVFASTTVAIFLEAIKTRARIKMTPFALNAYTRSACVRIFVKRENSGWNGKCGRNRETKYEFFSLCLFYSTGSSLDARVYYSPTILESMKRIFFLFFLFWFDEH